MERFHIVIIAIAVIVLILFLAAIGMALQSEGKDVAFPLMQAQCPDGWRTTADGCTHEDMNKGDIDDGTALSDADKVVWDSRNYRNFTFKTTATLCDKNKWARNRGGIKWDGISNYNKCP